VQVEDVAEEEGQRGTETRSLEVLPGAQQAEDGGESLEEGEPEVLDVRRMQREDEAIAAAIDFITK